MNPKLNFTAAGLFALATLAPQTGASQWKTYGPYGGTVPALATHAGALYAATFNGVFKSQDNAVTWTAANAGLHNQQVYDLLSTTAGIYAATNGSGIFFSADNGATWSARNNGLSNLSVYSLFATSTGIFAGTSGGVFYTSNGGLLWNPANSGIPNSYVTRAWVSAGDTVFAGTYSQGLYRSMNNGASWTKIGNFYPNTQITAYVYNLYKLGSTLFAGTNFGVYKSTDGGASWASSNTGIPGGVNVKAFTSDGGTLYAGTTGGMYASSDNGQTWTAANNGIKQWSITSAFEKYEWFNDMEVSGGNVVAASDEGIYRSSDGGGTWVYSDSGVRGNFVAGVATNSAAVFAGTGNSGMFVSTDEGNSWSRANNGIPAANIAAVAANSQYAFASVYNYYLYRSNDNGASWTPAHNGLGGSPLKLAATDSIVVALMGSGNVNPGGLMYSKDQGLNWTALPEVAGDISAVAIDNNKIYVGTGNGMVLYTSNLGQSWHDISGYLPNVRVNAIYPNDSIIYAGTEGLGIYKFTNYGANVQPMNAGLGGSFVLDITGAQGLIFASVFNAGIFASAPDGHQWFPLNNGLDDFNVRSFAVGSDQLYAGAATGVFFSGDENGFFSDARIYSGIDEATDDGLSIFPNPSPGIFQLKGSSNAEVKIFDVTGRLIAEKLITDGSIDLRSFVPGIYNANIRSAKGTFSQKLVVTDH